MYWASPGAIPGPDRLSRDVGGLAMRRGSRRTIWYTRVYLPVHPGRTRPTIGHAVTGSARGASGAAGSLTWNVDPLPTWLSTVMVPSWAVTME